MEVDEDSDNKIQNKIIKIESIQEHDKNKLLYTETSVLKFPEEDQQEYKIACSSKSLKKARKHIEIIKKEVKKATSLWTDICSAVFGIFFSFLISLWRSQESYKPQDLWIYVITLVSFFVWLWLKHRPNISINERIDLVLDELPNINETKNLRN